MALCEARGQVGRGQKQAPESHDVAETSRHHILRAVWREAPNRDDGDRGGGVVLVVHPPRARRLDQVHVGQAPTVMLAELLHHVREGHLRVGVTDIVRSNPLVGGEGELNLSPAGFNYGLN